MRAEFEQIYGAGSITAVHVVSYNSSIAKLVAQYTTTRTALQDLLSHYDGRLQHAAAAAARHERRLQAGSGGGGRRSKVSAALRAPFKALFRALSLLPGQLPQLVVAPTAGQPAAQVGGGTSEAAFEAAGMRKEQEGSNNDDDDSTGAAVQGTAGAAAAGTQPGRPQRRQHKSSVKPIKLIKVFAA